MVALFCPGAPAGSTMVPPSLPLPPPPPANAPFDYQIGGAYPPPAGTAVLSRDRRDPPDPAAYSICYVNAFQTQPDEMQSVWHRHPDLLLRRTGVRLPAHADPAVEADARRYWVRDSAWNELLLDISTATKRTALAILVGAWIDSCARDGFQAVEFDNLDSWNRSLESRRSLRRRDAVAYASLLVERAHAAGLAAAQKNTPGLSRDRAAIGFDFAIAEECARFGECDAYTREYGAHVIDVEYRRQDFVRACRDPAVGAALSVVRRDRAVSPRGARGYVFDTC
jgi:hypothetical protein